MNIDHPVFSTVEDAITVIKSDYTIITKVSRQELRNPVCIVWLVKDGKIVSEPWDTIHGLWVVCPDNYQRIERGILSRIKLLEEADIQRLEKKVNVIRGSLDFLSQNFSKIDHPLMALCEAGEHIFIGYFDRENKCLYRDTVSRYSIALGKTVNAATMNLDRDYVITNIVSLRDNKRVTEKLLLFLEDLKRDVAQCIKMVDLYKENLKFIEPYKS